MGAPTHFLSLPFPGMSEPGAKTNPSLPSPRTDRQTDSTAHREPAQPCGGGEGRGPGGKHGQGGSALCCQSAGVDVEDFGGKSEGWGLWESVNKEPGREVERGSCEGSRGHLRAQIPRGEADLMASNSLIALSP